LDEQPQPETLLSRIKRAMTGRRRALTEKELQDAINSSEEEGILNEAEGDMLQSIFEFGDTIVREVMVPRTDMVCCSADASLEELRNLILQTGHSRIPIYEGSLDRIAGVLYAKDLLRYWGAESRELNLREVMRKAYFIPETNRIESLLDIFRVERVHIVQFGDARNRVAQAAQSSQLLGDQRCLDGRVRKIDDKLHFATIVDLSRPANGRIRTVGGL